MTYRKENLLQILREEFFFLSARNDKRRFWALIFNCRCLAIVWPHNALLCSPDHNYLSQELMFDRRPPHFLFIPLPWRRAIFREGGTMGAAPSTPATPATTPAATSPVDEVSGVQYSAAVWQLGGLQIPVEAPAKDGKGGVSTLSIQSSVSVSSLEGCRQAPRCPTPSDLVIVRQRDWLHDVIYSQPSLYSLLSPLPSRRRNWIKKPRLL